MAAALPPINNYAVIWRPLAPSESAAISDSTENVLNRWGYTNDTRSEITYGYTDADGNWHLPYICQLSTLVNLLSQRKGVFFFASHCTPTEIGIEAYSDQASCDAAKSYYESKGYTGLSVQPAEGLWMLCVDEEFVHQHFHADLVFDMGCYADARRCDFWQSAAIIHPLGRRYPLHCLRNLAPERHGVTEAVEVTG